MTTLTALLHSCYYLFTVESESTHNNGHLFYPRLQKSMRPYRPKRELNREYYLNV